MSRYDLDVGATVNKYQKKSYMMKPAVISTRYLISKVLTISYSEVSSSDLRPETG